MLLAVVILSKLIIKACHRTENPTHQRKLEVAVTEGKTVLLYKQQSLENCLNETLYSVLSAKIRLQYRAVVRNLTNKLICVNLPKGTLLSWQSIPPSFRETAA